LTQAADTYKQHSFKLYDQTKQQAQDRGSVYESEVTLNKPTAVKLDGAYPIIGK
jgi:hypothetical protein